MRGWPRMWSYKIKQTQLLMIVRFLLSIHGVSDGVTDTLLNALVRLKSTAKGQPNVLGPWEGTNLISGFPSKVDLSRPDLVRTGAPWPPRPKLRASWNRKIISGKKFFCERCIWWISFNLGLFAVLFVVFEPSYQMFRQALHVTDNFLDVLIFINKLWLLFLPRKAIRWVPKGRRI